MSGWHEWAVTLAVFLPALGALVIAFLPSRDEQAARWWAIVFSGAALLVGIAMLFGFDYGGAGLQFQMNASWISALHIRYHVGVDGIDLPLLELTLLLSFLCAVYTYRILPSPGKPHMCSVPCGRGARGGPAGGQRARCLSAIR